MTRLVECCTAFGTWLVCWQGLVGCHAAARDVTPKSQKPVFSPMAPADASVVSTQERVSAVDARPQIDISAPAKPACTIKTQLTSTVSLRLAEGAKPFAELRFAPVTLLLPEGAPLINLVIESETDGVWVRGVGEVAELEFHPNRAVVLDAIVIPNVQARLQLLGAVSESLQIAYVSSGPADPQLIPEPRVSGSVSCDGVDLEPARFDPVSALDAQSPSAARLEGGIRVHIAAAPGKRPFAEMRTSRPQTVAVVEEQGNFARIAIARDTDVVVGWVPKAYLKPEVIGLGNIGTIGHGAGTGRGYGFPIHGTIRCPHDVPLRVELDNITKTVGILRAEHGVEIDESLGDHYAVQPRTPSLTAVNGARFLLAAADLDACQIKTPPSTRTMQEHKATSWPRSGPARPESAPIGPKPVPQPTEHDPRTAPPPPERLPLNSDP